MADGRPATRSASSSAVPSEVVIPSPSCPAREEEAGDFGVRADDRERVGGRGAKASPGADGRQVGQPGHEPQSLVDHPADHVRLDCWVYHVVLPPTSR